MNYYTYCVLDVFTRERYKGNPLAVVFTEGDLLLSSYENIAREFGYSETSFVYYSKQDKALKVRSFTPAGFEVKGAGHNLLGAVSAALLCNMDIFSEQQGRYFVIMKDETIFLSIDHKDNDLPFIGMMQRPATIETMVSPEAVAAAISLNPDEISAGGLSPAVVRTEVAHLILPLNNVDILDKAAPNKSLLAEIASTYKFEGVYCFTIVEEDPQYIAQARFFNPGMGIDEDAATGSAAGPLAGFLYKKKYVTSNTVYQILQGVKMKQPSVIEFEVTTEGIWVGGSAVIVMEGTIYE